MWQWRRAKYTRKEITMGNNIYFETFINLNIPIEQLPENYSPEEFGRKLFSASQYKYDVRYAASTDYTGISRSNTNKDFKKLTNKYI